MSPHMDELVGAKPSLDEVIRYAIKQVQKSIRDRAAHLPKEQAEEIAQEALIRCANAYGSLDPERGWKAFVQTHCLGACLDYLRDGNGFKENRWDDKPEEPDPEPPVTDEEHQEREAPPPAAVQAKNAGRFRPRRLHRRVSVVNEDSQALDVEEVAGIAGVFSLQEGDDLDLRPRWELVARMASVDREILLVAKILRGFTQTELADDMGCTREMLSQRIRSFFSRLDSPEFYHSRWVRATIYAFGLEDRYHVPQKERGHQGVGFDLRPLDLDARESLSLMTLMKQESLF